MHIQLAADLSQAQVTDRLRQLRSGDRVHCYDVRQFKVAVSILQAWRWANVLVLLLGQDNQVIEQFKYQAQSKTEQQPGRDRHLQDQEQVVQALEKVFAHCKQVGLQVVSFSDGLVVVPEQLAADPMALSSPEALGVNDYEAYTTITEQLES
ncbi:MAG: hypothetical protein QGG88_12375 [Gammaproteobacteria bacterium]|jgi:hypothetical protein|nr:hypothetical protein [Gammaproteobacteria bacterium]